KVAVPFQCGPGEGCPGNARDVFGVDLQGVFLRRRRVCRRAGGTRIVAHAKAPCTGEWFPQCFRMTHTTRNGSWHVGCRGHLCICIFGEARTSVASTASRGILTSSPVVASKLRNRLITVLRCRSTRDAVVLIDPESRKCSIVVITSS